MLDNIPPGAHAERFKTMLSDPNFHIFYHAPVLILIAATSPGPWIAEDCALVAENLMLAACAAGLGSCWIGFAQGFLNTPAGKSMARLPEACVPVAPVIVGHPKTVAPQVPRKGPDIRWA
jgi:nitroreductase